MWTLLHGNCSAWHSLVLLSLTISMPSLYCCHNCKYVDIVLIGKNVQQLSDFSSYISASWDAIKVTFATNYLLAPALQIIFHSERFLSLQQKFLPLQCHLFLPPTNHATSPIHGHGGHIHVADLPSPIWSSLRRNGRRKKTLWVAQSGFWDALSGFFTGTDPKTTFVHCYAK